jgi:phosphomannomutase
MPIKFGTDGWRAVISDEFTFANLRIVAEAVARHAGAAAPAGRPPQWVIGFDTRFLSDRYAQEVAGVFAAHGMRVFLARTDAPTPAISYAVRHLAADGAVMITASHNPPRYNGLKLKAHYGGSANGATIAQVEAELAAVLAGQVQPAVLSLADGEASGLIERFDPMPVYLAHVSSLLDMNRVACCCPSVVVDPMYGAGRAYMRDFLSSAGCRVHEIRGNLNPGFGGIHPEPIDRNLGELKKALADGNWTIGLATDGDADRIGAMTPAGRFVDPHVIFSLVLRYLVQRRGQRGDVVKTVSTTQMLNRLAALYGLRLHETPVGFDHIGELMLCNDVLIGGEESGGITIRGHIPEGDGILIGLLLVEVLADSGLSLDDLIADLMHEVGDFYYGRRDYQVQAFSKPELVARLMGHLPHTIAGLPVASASDLDGVKYVTEDGSWLLIRPSGTEPVLRVYAEARRPENVELLLEAGNQLAWA